MSRLPVVSADGNTWGTVLNDFLSVSLNADGTIKNLFVNVKNLPYGAKGDGKTVTDGAITTGTPTLTSASAAFTAADVGKQITVNGAGAAAANLNTTISAWVNATTVTLAANASTTVSVATFLYGTDDTAAIAAALLAASPTGGTVYFPSGTYISGNQTLYAKVHLLGAGITATVIKLKALANTDLFSAQASSINLSSAVASGIIGTLYDFTIREMTLDGNKANQTAGPSYPLRFYGYNFVFRDLEITNGYTGGILCDWNGGGLISQPSDEMEGTIDSIKVHDCNGIGIQMGGPHDSCLLHVFSFNNGSHGFHIAPNAQAMLLTQCHPYHNGAGVNAVGFLIEGGSTQMLNNICEGSDTAQVVILGNTCSFIGGQVFGTAGFAGVGLQLGQSAGNTPYPSQIYQSAGVTTAVQVSGTYVSTTFTSNTAGAIDYQNEINTIVEALIYASSGGVLVGGRTPNYLGRISHSVSGLTPDGSQNTTNLYSFAGPGFTMFRILGSDGTPVLAVNGTNNILSFQNKTLVRGYSDYAVTQTFQLDTNTGDIATSGNLALGQSATAVALAASGTIATANLGVSRVAPTGNVTAIILATGTIPGQIVTVVNESAFTVTFAASGTSHVADGVSDVIAATSARRYVWDSGTSLWYKCI